MEPTFSELRSIPLLENINDDLLARLVELFERRQYQPGDILFCRGDRPTDLLLLIKGQVSLMQDDTVRFRLHPIAPIGELGALTGLDRRTTAKVSEPSEVWRIAASELLQFFQSNSDVALPFYQNLLNVVANKVRKDSRRIDEMRSNIVRTQKSMKRMRDLLLESQDTPVSNPIHDTLERLIEQNRRWHYMVEPVRTLPAVVRFDDGSTSRVVGISDGWLSLQKPDALSTQPGTRMSAVLVLPMGEIPISGTIDSVDDTSLVIALDLLIDQYAAVLEDYLTRLHLLEFVV